LNIDSRVLFNDANTLMVRLPIAYKRYGVAVDVGLYDTSIDENAQRNYIIVLQVDELRPNSSS
jgi:hypothetical protein